MAHYFGKEKWKRRSVLALSVALTASLSLGLFAACTGTTDDTTDEDDETTTTQTDTQTIRNGNFEFYSEMDEDLADKRDLISSPNDWTFSSGSPTSDTASGIIDVSEWTTLTVSGSPYFSGVSSAVAEMDDDEKDSYFTEHLSEFVAHWEDKEVTVYDRLKFYSDFEDQIDDTDLLPSDSDAAELFADYTYSIDFEDVEYLSGLETPTARTDAAEDETAVLMIHNRRTSDGVVGTGQHYTSGTTITLEAGTSAELSVWVRTEALEYGYEDNTASPRSGAYIEVAQTVGGTSLDDWRIENIRTDGEWQQYTLYLCANSYAETTFTVALGLGGGTTDDRYESINGYAFFDDLSCTVISNAQYEVSTSGLSESYTADLNSSEEAKTFDDSALKSNSGYARTFALDLYMPLETLDLYDEGNYTFSAGVTTETSGSRTYSSKVESNIGSPSVSTDRQSLIGMYTYSELLQQAESNLYLKSLTTTEENGGTGDFTGGFPFTAADGSSLNDIRTILLLSTNGAAYTAKLSVPDSNSEEDFTLGSNEYMLVSFWVKTSAIRSGATGASVTLVDGENRTVIEAFDTTTADTVDIDDDTTDIYNGWVQCFFYVANETDTEKTFSLEFHYGPTDVASAATSAYADGYAAFTNFEISVMTSTQYEYAASTDYAQKVSLTGDVDNDSQFDSVSATSDIEKSLAKPSSFMGVLAGSNVLVPGTDEKPAPENTVPDGVYTGMLNAQYADNYFGSADKWAEELKNVTGTSGYTGTAEEWWRAVFGSGTTGARVANQPLAIYNSGSEAVSSYGYILRSSVSVAEDTTQRISVRVKLSSAATATVYLIDTSDAKAGYNNTLTPTIPNITYWYDDDGNILRMDPTSDDFNAREDTLYYLADNGLYYAAGTSEDDADVVYYANLHNYDKDEEGNYVTSDGTIAFYYNAADGNYYAYRTETGLNSYSYSQVVQNLPTTDEEGTSIVRYEAPADASAYGTAITISGSEENDGWVEVVFYVQTGNEAKDFRLEVWAGSRDNSTDGIPAGGYVFFDDYVSETTSDYDTLLDEAVDDLMQDPGNISPDDDTKLTSEHALYYTYTFYDATDYLRYDINEDEDELGNPYGSYTQSSYSEEIVWLQNGTTMFLNYGATDVTVEQDDLGSSDDTETDDTTDTTSDTNIWLIISSGILAVALLFTVIAIIVRRVHAKVAKNAKVKPAKAPKASAAKPVKPVKPAEPEAPETTPDEDAPYND